MTLDLKLVADDLPKSEPPKDELEQPPTAAPPPKRVALPELKLLVEWSSPWEEFKESIRPAMSRAGKPLAGEAQVGLFPYRGMLMSWAGEVLLFVLVIIASRGYDSMHPYQPPPPPKYDVIYFSGDELPKMEDAGGVQAGRTGKGGGREGLHRSQTIRVAREERLREKVVDAPKLNLPHSDSAVANLLAYKSVPGPPPAEGLKSSQRPSLTPDMTAIAPAPDVDRSRLQSAPALNSAVVPPAPLVVDREEMKSAPALTSSVVPPTPSAQNLASPRLPGSQSMQVIPPPVSAPEQVSNANPKLTLPAQLVVAPPPVQIARDAPTQGPGFGSGDLHRQVVPPPVQMGSTTGDPRSMGGFGGTTVVPPPVQIGSATGDPRSRAGLGSASVVPPPVQMVGGGSLAHQPVSGLGGGLSAVPPAPTMSGGDALNGHGRGNRGLGSGGAGELGEVTAPPSGGGTGKGVGVVVSNQPGPKVGVPGGAGSGSLSMSPNGGPNAGLGGSGGGGGIGRGNGPGSGLTGTGSGAAREGPGRGSDTSARGGTSPFPGPGGTGSGGVSSAMPGVSVKGGQIPAIITLPSFGSDGSQQPATPGRSGAGPDDRPGLNVEASPRSGGALPAYGMLLGDKVYSIYIETVLGTVVMQFADPTSATRGHAYELTAPKPIRADLPANIKPSRLIIACVLDRSGIIRNAKVLESASPQMAAKILAALPSWKFHPAMRGDQPVEVNALLGFAIDTSDRY